MFVTCYRKQCLQCMPLVTVSSVVSITGFVCLFTAIRQRHTNRLSTWDPAAPVALSVYRDCCATRFLLFHIGGLNLIDL